MDVYGYITVSTDALKTTAQNGVDICEIICMFWWSTLRLKTGSVLEFLLEIKLQLNIYIHEDDRYEEAQTATLVLVLTQPQQLLD